MAVLRQDIDQNIQVTKDNVTSCMHIKTRQRAFIYIFICPLY